MKIRPRVLILAVSAHSNTWCAPREWRYLSTTDKTWEASSQKLRCLKTEVLGTAGGDATRRTRNWIQT